MNDYVEKPENIFKEKFNNYIKFAEEFSQPTALTNSFTGNGYKLADDISIYCLNTSICSSGGLHDINDQQYL